MSDDERGVIHNRERARQIRNFSGLRFQNITPTDIDGMIEYHNLCYVYMETKYKDAELPPGQRLALERQTDDLQKIKPCICIVCSHDITDPNQDIDMANTTVTEYRWNGAWRTKENTTTTKDLVERFISWVNTEHNELTGGTK